MTRDDIIRIARSDEWAADVSPGKWDDFFVRFAEKIAAAEREACAKVCMDLKPTPEIPDDEPEIWWEHGCIDCAAAIRARGQE